jgi:DNA transformation protein
MQLLMEQLGDSGVTSRAMFGGHGIYRDGWMFALVYGGAVYMKVSEAGAKTSERPAFTPREGQTFATFRQVSADDLQDPKVLSALAKRAQTAATKSP